MLNVSELTRFYGSHCAVDKVSFNASPGQIVGLLGHNGAGKTTIMKMLSGYLEPDAGSIEFDGQSVLDQPSSLQCRLGYLPESSPLYPELSVAQYLDYAASLKGLEGTEKQQSVKAAIAATELNDQLLAPIATLSRGYKQRVGVAQALLGNPRLIILDEPTNGLDPSQTEHMRAVIRKLAQDAIVILSTHIMQEVEALCDRVLIINQGRLVVDENLSELRQSNHLVVGTNLTEADARKAFMLEGVAQIEPLEAGFRLHLHDGANARQLASQVATLIVNQGAEVYQLTQENRDLESLFLQVSHKSNPLPTPTEQKEEPAHV